MSASCQLAQVAGQKHNAKWFVNSCEEREYKLLRKRRCLVCLPVEFFKLRFLFGNVSSACQSLQSNLHDRGLLWVEVKIRYSVCTLSLSCVINSWVATNKVLISSNFLHDKIVLYNAPLAAFLYWKTPFIYRLAASAQESLVNKKQPQ